MKNVLIRLVHREKQDAQDQRNAGHDLQDKMIYPVYPLSSSSEANPVFLFNLFIMQSPCDSLGDAATKSYQVKCILFEKEKQDPAISQACADCPYFC